MTVPQKSVPLSPELTSLTAQIWLPQCLCNLVAPLQIKKEDQQFTE